MKHVGIYSGTFDPIHDGHIGFAKKASTICKLSTVYFLPEANPRNKHLSSNHNERIVALEQVIKNESSLKLIALQDAQFTIARTIPALRERLPDSYFTFLFGSDVVKNLHTWPNIASLLDGSSIAIGLRNLDTNTGVDKIMSDLKEKVGFNFHYTIMQSDYPGLSSSFYRKSPKKNET